MKKCNAVAKVIMLGKSNSGKSCLVDRYVLKDFDGHKSPTVGLVHAHNKELIKNEEIRLFVWDTAGCEKYRALTRMYYRDAVAAVICYDITDRASWDDVAFWLNGITEKEACALYLVGTKKDLLTEKWSRQHRVVTADEIVALMSSIPDANLIRSYETSSKTGENVELVFQDIARDFTMRAKKAPSTNNNHHPIRLQQTIEQHHPCCP